MKKFVFVLLFLCIAFSGVSQEEKKHNFTHTLTENIGLIYKFNLQCDGFYPSISSAYSFLNLIPSYELGYNNNMFLKLKFRNVEDNIKYDRGYTRNNEYSVLFRYNVLKKTSSHSLKFGVGYALLSGIEKYVDYDENGQDLPHRYERFTKNTFLIDLSYSYKVTPHFAFGFDMDLYQIIAFTEFSMAFSYTF